MTASNDPKPLKRYFIQVKGFDGRYVEAATAGKAKYAEYKLWQEAGYGGGIGTSCRSFAAKLKPSITTGEYGHDRYSL